MKKLTKTTIIKTKRRNKKSLERLVPEELFKSPQKKLKDRKGIEICQNCQSTILIKNGIDIILRK